MEHLILRYGVIAIFLGAGIEGEPFALAGGILAHRHWMSPELAIIACIAGSWLVDQMWFNLSRHYRESRLIKRLALRPAFARSIGFIERHPVKFVLLFRFAYGLRAVTAAAIGVSRVSPRLFMPLDLVAATAWAVLFVLLGELAGPAIEALEVRYGSVMALAVACLSLAALAYALRRRG